MCATLCNDCVELKKGGCVMPVTSIGKSWHLRFNAVVAALAIGLVGFAADTASAQTYGFVTLPPGSLNHTTASAVSKVLKEKGGLNVLVQPAAGDSVIIPMVG